MYFVTKVARIVRFIINRSGFVALFYISWSRLKTQAFSQYFKVKAFFLAQASL